MRTRAFLMTLGTIALVMGAGCKDEGPTFGAIRVSVATTGSDLDLDGYTVGLDGPSQLTIAMNGARLFSPVPTGSHQVALGGVAPNCTVSDGNYRSVTIRDGQTTDVAFAVTCLATTGTIEVTVATSGAELDPDGYTIGVDESCGWDDCGPAWSDRAGVNDTVRFARIPPGEHTVYLYGVAGNCTATGANSPVTVAPGDTAKIAFAVTCQQAGSARVTVTTTGADLDPDGYVVDVSGYGGYSLGVNASVTIPQLLPGEYAVRLHGLAGNCTVGGQNPATVTILAGATVDVAFAVTCAALGILQVKAATTGVDLDPDGYSVRVQGPGFDRSYSVAPGGTVTVPGLVAGDYVIALRGAAPNCEVTSANPRTVAVPSGGSAVAQFDLVCAAPAQLAAVIGSDGNAEIYLINSNGTGLTRLTTNAVADVQPVWSPDGEKIAFATNRDGGFELYVMNADGQNPVRLTTAPGADSTPAWSPDGSKVAFTSERDGNAEIYVMDADGSNPVRLTNQPGPDADPAWSPDGSKIAFTSSRAGNAEIYVMDATGSGLTRLTSNTVDDVQPAWSPDGTKLVFSRLAWCDAVTHVCDYDLFVMNADGSGAAQVTFDSSPSSDNDPAWSPDGRWIAYGARFYSSSCGWDDCTYYYDRSAVQLVRADRTGAAELVRDALQPAWRP